MTIFGRIIFVFVAGVLAAACQPPAGQTDTKAPAPAATDASKVAGNWGGVLEAQGQKFELLFKVSANPDGTIKASIDSVSQGVKDIPVEAASFKDSHLILEAKSILGVLDVALQGDNTLTGKWNQAGASYPIELKRTN